MLEDNAAINNEHQIVVRSTTLGQQQIENNMLSKDILNAYRRIAQRNAIAAFELSLEPIGGLGENSYGSVLRVLLTPTHLDPTTRPLHTVLKIAPTSQARRDHMRVKDAYTREVFMYTSVFNEYSTLNSSNGSAYFTLAPKMLHASLNDCEEFIIFEDLCSKGFTVNARTNIPTYDLVVCAFRAIAQLHAMSFVLKARQPQRFATLVAQMDDNIFTADMKPVSLEFGKKYVRRTRHLLEEDLNASQKEDTPEMKEVFKALHIMEDRFQEICMDAVNGAAYAPYSVICHGDFWNNNILYEFNSTNERTAINAKLIDFQISRYSPPVLDLIHYLFACTEKTLRDEYFHQFMQIYYDTLSQYIRDYQLDPTVLYPEAVFRQQLRQFGGYGFCMSAFSVPFFISNASELHDLDTVSEALQEISSTKENIDMNEASNAVGVGVGVGAGVEMGDKNNSKPKLTKSQSAAEFVDEYDLITERTLPIFKRRMIGNALDLQKYEMIEALLKYNRVRDTCM